MKDLDAFISYSRSDEAWATELSQALDTAGLDTWIDKHRLVAGSNWRDMLEDAARHANNIIVFVGPHQEPDAAQSREAEAVLQAVWDDPSKRVIPILMGDVEPPGFVRSAAGGEIHAIRVANPRRDFKKAVNDLLKVLKDGAPLEDVAETIDTKSEDNARQQRRLSYIQGVAERFSKGSSGR
jgi:hypothetical protein